MIHLCRFFPGQPLGSPDSPLTTKSQADPTCSVTSAAHIYDTTGGTEMGKVGLPQMTGANHVYGVLETAPPKPEAHLRSLTMMAVGGGGSKAQQHDYTSLHVAA